jgi:hypothetical protein
LTAPAKSDVGLGCSHLSATNSQPSGIRQHVLAAPAAGDQDRNTVTKIAEARFVVPSHAARREQG